MVQVYTGNGKGKTTAALGVALRAVSVGKRVAIVAFDKGGDHYSERGIIATHLKEIDLFATGCDRIDPATGAFRFGVTDADRREGERGLSVVRTLFDDAKHDIIILDEINVSTALGIVDETAVLSVLDRKPPTTELILTGRGAPPSFLARADLVTDMASSAHYFDHGEISRKGIDY
jgi:cob(I)alamin adenosyltransferase